MVGFDFGLQVLLLLILLSSAAATFFIVRARRGKLTLSRNHRTGEEGITSLPLRGLLIPEGLADAVAPDALALLEQSATPVTIEYFPLSDLKSQDFELMPVNPMLQKALLDIINLVGRKGETLYRVSLPAGAELVKAVGKIGFRGFSRSGGKLAHGVFTPVVVGGAAAAAWPIVAVTGSLMVLDGVAQHQQRVHQRIVQSILTRQESRFFDDQLAQQQTLNKRISREIAQIQDGSVVSLEESRTQANLLFTKSQKFLEDTRQNLDKLVSGNSSVDYRKLQTLLGGESKDVDYFFRHLHLAQSAIALEKRAVIAYAASMALQDPDNPYKKLQSVLREEAAEIERSEELISRLNDSLATLEMRGNWFDQQRDKILSTKWSISVKQDELRSRLGRIVGSEGGELQFTVTAAGELLRVVPTPNSE